MFSAKGAGSCNLAAARKSCCPKRALKARVKAAFASIPHIAFVEVDAAFVQKVAILLLKTMGAMVLFLALHVFQNRIKLTWAH